MAKILIVGGVAVGATTAARLSRLNSNDEIIMFERDEHISFANCGLPYYLSGKIADRENLLLQTPENFKSQYGVDVRIWNEVIKIDTERKRVIVKEVKTGNHYEETYDYLVLGLGAKPIFPLLPGIEKAQNIFTVRNVADIDKLYDVVQQKPQQHALVIGGGFIGLEVAENLVEKGFTVTLVNKAPRVLAPLDDEMAKMVENILTQEGIILRSNMAVTAFEDNGTVAVLEDETKLTVDFTVMAIGVVPEVSLAKQAGLVIGDTGGIVTNKYMQTSDPFIYAGGDAVEITHLITGKSTRIPLAGPANRQGRLIADNIHGKQKSYKGSLGSSVLKVFDYTVASTGLNAQQLTNEKMVYEEVHIHRGNHAGYYPGASDITLKILFNPKTGAIYGAQAIGKEGVEKRIDVIATAIKAKLTVEELTELELTYAPPYSSAKDPVNIAGYVASNMMEGTHRTFKVQDIPRLLAEQATIIDVRTADEFALGHIPGSQNIPVAQIQDNTFKLSGKGPFYVLCQVGLRGYLAQQILQQHNKDSVFYNLSGGYKLYQAYIQDNETGTQKSCRRTNENEQGSDCLNSEKHIVQKIDVCGMQCPSPILKLKSAMENLAEGEAVEIQATDRGFIQDAQSWCKTSGNNFVTTKKHQGIYTAIIEKANSGESCQKKQTLVVFSNDYDKLMASLIIANGALAMGKQVSIFFTFWGLAALKKTKKIQMQKTFIEKMFSWMLPKSIENTPLSKMNFGGIGKKMMLYIMKKKNVMTLTELMDCYQKSGGKLIACTMSMDVMGIKEEELIEGVDFAGVATYLEDAQGADHNLFI